MPEASNPSLLSARPLGRFGRLVAAGACGCALVAVGCGDGENGKTDPVDAGSSWSTTFQGLQGALISIWGSDESDVWAVGSDPLDGDGPLVLRYDGSNWSRLRASASGDLWWVHGVSDGSVLVGGADGVILEYRDAVFRPQTTPSSQGTVFGIWAAGPDDVWAVGGDLEGGTGAFVWRRGATGWTNIDLPPEISGDAFFKVWGRGSDDVWMVGSTGTSLHYDGTSLTAVATGQDPLFTVHASPDRWCAVGGFDLATLLEHDGSGAWAPVETPASTRQLFGVWLTAQGGWAVGVDGTVLRRDASGWLREDTGLENDVAFHAVWVDPGGSVWAVGGDVLVPPLGRGTLVRRGDPVPAGRLEVIDAIGK